MKKLLCFAVLCILSVAPVGADVRGIAYGFADQVTLDFDGLGGCRLLMHYDRETVIDFPAGDLAESCAKLDTGGFYWTTVPVEDAESFYVSVVGHFTALGVALQP